MRGKPVRWVVATIAASALLLAACGDDGGGGAEPEASEAPGGITVTAMDTLDFDSDEYRAAAGEIDVEYQGAGMFHTLTVEGFEEQILLETMNRTVDTGTITLEPGTYTLYCNVPGHREAGMEARLTVVE